MLGLLDVDDEEDGIRDEITILDRRCISIPAFSMLINSTLGGFFKSSKQLRLGDPLSPFLFILVMEGLSRMLQRGEEMGLLAGVEGRRGEGGISISHMMFVDDMIIFCTPDERHFRHLRCIFLSFEVVSGLRVNLGKSKLILVRDD